MNQDPINLMPTALRWDSNGELCSEALSHLLDRLQAQDVTSGDQEV